MKVAGWDVKGQLPKGGKGVLIASPHTSNWDLPYMMAVAWIFRLRINWLGKHTLFKSWHGPFMRWLGGVPVDRSASHGVVDQAAALLTDSDGMYLAVAPAGTRGRAAHWKSGFYHIANTAKVPVVFAFLDFENKVGGVGPGFVPTGDIQADMDKIRAFYDGMKGFRPELSTLMMLKEEMTEEAQAA